MLRYDSAPLWGESVRQAEICRDKSTTAAGTRRIVE